MAAAVNENHLCKRTINGFGVQCDVNRNLTLISFLFDYYSHVWKHLEMAAMLEE